MGVVGLLVLLTVPIKIEGTSPQTAIQIHQAERTTATLNIYKYPTSTSWHGVTINYQQDGNSQMYDYPIWLDKVNFSYW